MWAGTSPPLVACSLQLPFSRPGDYLITVEGRAGGGTLFQGRALCLAQQGSPELTPEKGLRCKASHSFTSINVTPCCFYY